MPILLGDSALNTWVEDQFLALQSPFHSSQQTSEPFEHS